jgi:hypothetical protein
LESDNIHLFSFFTAEHVICDPNNYKDVAHHRGSINDWILQCMKEGEYELTKDNYEDYCQQEWAFFHNYDYDKLFSN